MKKFQQYDMGSHQSEMTGMIYNVNPVILIIKFEILNTSLSGVKEEPLTFRRYSFLTLMFLPEHVSELSQTIELL